VDSSSSYSVLLALLGAVASINPVWLYGPYTPGQISAGSQPDFYMGWIDGLVRMAPPLETHAFGYNHLLEYFAARFNYSWFDLILQWRSTHGLKVGSL